MGGPICQVATPIPLLFAGSTWDGKRIKAFPLDEVVAMLDDEEEV